MNRTLVKRFLGKLCAAQKPRRAHDGTRSFNQQFGERRCVGSGPARGASGDFRAHSNGDSDLLGFKPSVCDRSTAAPVPVERPIGRAQRLRRIELRT